MLTGPLLTLTWWWDHWGWGCNPFLNLGRPKSQVRRHTRRRCCTACCLHSDKRLAVCSSICRRSAESRNHRSRVCDRIAYYTKVHKVRACLREPREQEWRVA